MNKSEPKPKLKKFSFEAIGTHWSIEYDGHSQDGAIEQKILDRIEIFDRTYSRFKSDSLVSAVAAKAGTYEFPDDANELFALYEQLYDVTSGLVTPLIGNTLSDAGYDAQYSLVFSKKTVAPELPAVLTRQGNQVRISRPVLLDFGAAGKGYLVDIIGALMRTQGVGTAIINAGGDIAVFSENSAAIEIALEYPGDSTRAIGIASISSGSICGSSIHLRNWGTHHHIINPTNSESPMDLQAVWVTAQNAMVADGLSTALFFTDPDVLKSQFEFEYAIIKNDGSLETSHNFPATFFE